MTMLTVGFIFGVAGGLRGLEIDAKTMPNQGIWRSAINAGIVGLTGWLIGSLNIFRNSCYQPDAEALPLSNRNAPLLVNKTPALNHPYSD
jgi:hypothetical protein